ncbi:MAG: DUF3006 domain-containing protein [Clostridia bacterium]|nr:DUF3006 domain-containing protein [Clostridia bacterium]
MEKLIIDRIEGNFAICENEKCDIINISLDDLPEGAKEGRVLILKSDQTYIFDVEEENKRRERILKLQNSIFSD